MFTTQSNLLSKSGLSIAQANALLAGKGVLAGLGEAFLNTENKYGVNAFWSIAQARLETGNGTSKIARDKNNYFGIGAYDEDPYNMAYAYDSGAACIEKYGAFIKSYYLTPGGQHYNGATPAGVAKKWATDPNYATKLVAIMNDMADAAGSDNTADTASTPAPQQSSGTAHRVQSGENLTVISGKYGTTIDAFVSANKSKYPSITRDYIQAGWDLIVPGSSQVSAPTNDGLYITVPAGSAGYIINLANKYGTSRSQLKAWNVSKYPRFDENDSGYIQAGWVVRVR